MKTVKVNFKIRYNWNLSGSHSFVYNNKFLIDKITDRKNVILKTFFAPLIGDFNKYLWGHIFDTEDEYGIKSQNSLLSDCIKIQNICAIKGFAPRIWDVILLDYEGKTYPSLLTDNVIELSENRMEIMNNVLVTGREYGFYLKFPDYNQATNFRDGKYVDFQGSVLEDNYEEMMLERYKKKVLFSGNVYQSLPNLEGYRKGNRIKEDLTEYIKGKNVWDIGCSGGEFCRLSLDLGANRVLGVDLPEVIEGAFEVSNFMGYYNIDWLGLDMKRDQDLTFEFEPDVIFYMSMQRHLGLPPYLNRAKIIVYEQNGDETMEEIISRLEQFEVIKDLGVTGLDGRHSLILRHK